MAITTLQQQFNHDIQGLLDAEHRYLKGMEEMLKKATAPQVQQVLNVHIQQTQHQVDNLRQVCSLLGIPAERADNDEAKALVEGAKQAMEATSDTPALLNLAIGAHGDQIEHWEIATYRGLIATAKAMQQQQIMQLLQQNLQQEEETSQKIEQSTPTLLQQAGPQQFAQGSNTLGANPA